MGQPYVGEIRIFAGNFPPLGWALCDGQLLSISENDTLFILIGTTYGGDGQNTFGLPDLRGRVPIHQGTRSGNTVILGQKGGVESVILSVAQMPAHTHPFMASTSPGTAVNPTDNVVAANPSITFLRQQNPAVAMNPASGSATVSQNLPHTNLQPYLGLNFIISLFGIFPSQD